MIDISIIENINNFIEESYPEISKIEKLYCFEQLYSTYGRVIEDKVLMKETLDKCLNEIKQREKPHARISIWEPRWKDNVCLIAKYKVPNEKFEIVFTKTASLSKYVYEADGTWIKNNCTLDTNGKIPCYAVPMEALENKRILSTPIEEMER